METKKKSDTLIRIITGAVAIGIFVPVCIFSETIVFPIVIGLLCLIGVYEMAKCLSLDKNYAITIPMYLIALALPILRHGLFFKDNSTYFGLAIILMFCMLIYVLAYVMFKNNNIKLTEILPLYALFVYIVGCFVSMVIVRYTDANLAVGGKTVNGVYVYLLAFIGAWVCDTFAYFTGRFFGKHKLIPEISPKKTIEGSIGGIMFTVGSFALYTFIVNSCFGQSLSYLKVCIIGFVLSIISQIGDLVASSVKRQYELKDYGKLFPGHGGVLDRFDSVMLTAPTLVIMSLVLGYFNV